MNLSFFSTDQEEMLIELVEIEVIKELNNLPLAIDRVVDCTLDDEGNAGHTADSGRASASGTADSASAT